MRSNEGKPENPTHFIVIARVLEERLPGIYSYKLLCRRLADRSDAPVFPFDQSEMCPHPHGRQSERPSTEFDRYQALRDDVEQNVQLKQIGGIANLGQLGLD